MSISIYQSFERAYDQHWGCAGCKYSYGGRDTRNKAVQSVLYELQRAADAGKAQAYDVTVYEESVRTRRRKNQKARRQLCRQRGNTRGVLTTPRYRQ